MARIFEPTGDRPPGPPPFSSTVNDRPDSVTVPEQGGGAAEDGDDGVDPAVAIEVAHGDPPGQGGTGEPGPGRAAGVEQPTVPVPEQGRVHGQGDAEAGPVEDVAVPLDQVEPAIGVEVGQGQAEADDRPGRPGQAERLGGVDEGPAPGPEEADGPPAGEVAHQEVGPTVAVDVAEGQAHPRQEIPPAVEGDAGPEADLGEPEPPPVLEEAAGGPVVGDVKVDPGVADEVGREDARGLRPSGRSIPAVRDASANVPSPSFR